VAATFRALHDHWVRSRHAPGERRQCTSWQRAGKNRVAAQAKVYTSVACKL